MTRKLQKQVYYLESFSSKHTMKQYQFHLNRFFDYVGSKSDKVITGDNVIRYIIAMKKDGLSHAYRNNTLNAIKYYTEMNDLPLLNWKKIHNYLGEATTVNDLRGYTHEEIQKLLEVADARYRAIILTLASTGMRREALTEIKLNDMQYLPEYKIYKIKIYKGSKQQQICFTTPEAAAAINLHFKLNGKSGEYFHHISPMAVSKALRKLNVKSRMRQIAAGARQGQYRESVPSVHGFRKFAITQMKRAKVDTEIRKFLVGHSIGVANRYIEFTEDDLLQEYLKAVDLLTISEENRLAMKVEQLQAKQDEIMQLRVEMDKLKQMMTKASPMAS